MGFFKKDHSKDKHKSQWNARNYTEKQLKKINKKLKKLDKIARSLKFCHEDLHKESAKTYVLAENLTKELTRAREQGLKIASENFKKTYGNYRPEFE